VNKKVDKGDGEGSLGGLISLKFFWELFVIVEVCG